MKKTVNQLVKGNYKDKKEVLEAIRTLRDTRLQKQEEEKTEVYLPTFFVDLQPVTSVQNTS